MEIIFFAKFPFTRDIQAPWIYARQDKSHNGNSNPGTLYMVKIILSYLQGTIRVCVDMDNVYE